MSLCPSTRSGFCPSSQTLPERVSTSEPSMGTRLLSVPKRGSSGGVISAFWPLSAPVLLACLWASVWRIGPTSSCSQRADCALGGFSAVFAEASQSGLKERRHQVGELPPPQAPTVGPVSSGPHAAVRYRPRTPRALVGCRHRSKRESFSPVLGEALGTGFEVGPTRVRGRMKKEPARSQSQSNVRGFGQAIGLISAPSTGIGAVEGRPCLVSGLTASITR